MDQVMVGETVLEHLQLNLELERKAVETLREAISHCRDVEDYTTRKMFEEMIASEETHIDWIENQLEAIRQVGLELYLSQQLKEE
jgi:bacterioferritin